MRDKLKSMNKATLQKIAEIRIRSSEEPRAGASEEAITALIKLAGSNLSDDYLEFLRFSDGLSDDLWSVNAILKERYPEARRLMPGALIIGNNGGPNLYAIDLRSGDLSKMQYVKTYTVGIGWENICGQWQSFYALLCYMFQDWDEDEQDENGW